jgi:pimeloyl-ACP methyl ester carboxylesterase
MMMNECFGLALDFSLRCRDWGFSLTEVKAPVYMLHSRGDSSVPLVTAELTARLLPHCTLTIKDTDVHFSEAALDDFIRTVVLDSGGAI